MPKEALSTFWITIFNSMQNQTSLNEFEFVVKQSEKKVNSVALLRVRNESLILEDTLEHLSQFVDVICAYDDASTDNTLEILKDNSRVGLVVSNQKWLGGISDRLLSETRHRQLLFQISKQSFSPTWIMGADADERYIGNLREIMESNPMKQADVITMSLFDAYMTPDDSEPFELGKLLNFRKYFGPEKREIKLMWKSDNCVGYEGLDSREPITFGEQESQILCQHYGKSISISEWEETCDYYVKHFPWETYGQKWMSRKGKAIHNVSDFGRPLYEWNETLFNSAVLI